MRYTVCLFVPVGYLHVTWLNFLFVFFTCWFVLMMMMKIISRQLLLLLLWLVLQLWFYFIARILCRIR